MHRIHLQPVFRPHTHAGVGAVHTLVGWDLGQGGAARRTFAPGATDLRATTEQSPFVCQNITTDLTNIAYFCMSPLPGGIAIRRVCLLVGSFVCYQRVSIASYANRWYSQRRNVRPSVTLRYCIKTKKASVMISSPFESQNILISRNIWFIAKFDRSHPERGRFLRLGWVRTGDFGDFSTNKPPYLRNGAR